MTAVEAVGRQVDLFRRRQVDEPDLGERRRPQLAVELSTGPIRFTTQMNKDCGLGDHAASLPRPQLRR